MNSSGISILDLQNKEVKKKSKVKKMLLQGLQFWRLTKQADNEQQLSRCLCLVLCPIR